jgi:chemotaxis protein MotB
MTKYRYTRRKYRSGGEGANHDRWLISYADFITLLFAFFVVLFASAYRDSQAVRRVSSAIHKGFQEMEPFAVMQAGARGGLAQQPATGPATISVVDIAKLRQQLEAAIGPEIRNHEVELRVTSEGFVISLREMGFFASGRADLLPGAAAKIQRIGTVLLQHGLEIRVEGHSDDQPINNSEFHSNWELSTARAITVLLLLVDQTKLDPTRISVAGYAQYRPVASNATPEGRRMNRRVDLVVVGSVASQPAAMTLPVASGK